MDQPIPIFSRRNLLVIRDVDLAKLLKTQTRTLNQTVKRNPSIFTESLSFYLNKEESEEFKVSKQGGSRYLPRVFSLEGCKALLSLMGDKKTTYKEKAMEDYLKERLSTVEKGLCLKKVQFNLGKNHRPDILAEDSKKVPVIIELQIGSLDRLHLYRSLNIEIFISSNMAFAHELF